MLQALLDSYFHFFPKYVWDPEGKDYTASYLPFEQLHKKRLMSDLSHSDASPTDDPEMDDSGEYCFLVVPEPDDLDGIKL